MRVEGLTATEKRRRAYRASPAAVMAEVGVTVPKRYFIGHPVRTNKENALAARIWSFLVIRRSGCQWTSHGKSSRHLCPVVVLDILSCILIPPSLLWSCLPPLPYDIITLWYRQTSKNLRCLPPALCVCRSVHLKCVHMGHKKKRSCIPLHYSTSTGLFFFIEGWFIRPIQNYTHTPTPPNSDGCIPRPPAVPAVFDDVFEQLYSFPNLSPFLSNWFHPLHFSKLQRKAKLCFWFTLWLQKKTMHSLRCHAALVPLLTLIPCFHLPLTAGRYHFQSC